MPESQMDAMLRRRKEQAGSQQEADLRRARARDAAALPAGSAVYLCNAHPGLLIGTVLLTTAPAYREHGERVGVITEDGNTYTVTSLSLSTMLPSEVPDWCKPSVSRTEVKA